jgi:predicted unusual protein kinase regulating ubiquinone biosynthesis (AarF/ABC1/UbiB family)
VPAIEESGDLRVSGPLFQLLAMFLGSRPDCVDDDQIDALLALGDGAEPMHAVNVRAALTSAWHAAPDTILGRFTSRPFASRTIDQFHAAILPDGTDVTIRVIRPDAEKLLAEAPRQSAALFSAISKYSRRQPADESLPADFLDWLSAECDASATQASRDQTLRELSTRHVTVVRSVPGGVATSVASGGGDVFTLFALDAALLRSAMPTSLTIANLGVAADGKCAWLSASGALEMTLSEARGVRDLWVALHSDDEAKAIRALRRSCNIADKTDTNRFEQLCLAAIRRHVAFPPDDVPADRGIHRVDRILIDILRASRLTGATLPPAAVRAHRLLIVAYRLARLQQPLAEPEQIGRQRLAQFGLEEAFGGASPEDLGRISIELLELLRVTPRRVNQIADDLVDGNLVISAISEESPRTAAAWTRRTRLLSITLASVGLAIVFVQSTESIVFGLSLRPILGMALAAIWLVASVQWLRLK